MANRSSLSRSLLLSSLGTDITLKYTSQSITFSCSIYWGHFRFMLMGFRASHPKYATLACWLFLNKATWERASPGKTLWPSLVPLRVGNKAPGGGGILPTQRLEGILTSRDRDWQRQWHKHTLLLLHSFATRSPSPPFWSNLHKSLPLYLKRYINRLLQSLPRCHTLGTYVLKKLNLGFFLLLLCLVSI